MPRRLSRPEWERFLRGRRVGVLATVGEGGEAVLTPIWYLYEGGRVLMRTGKQSAKARNIGRDSQVSLCVQDEQPPYRSVTLYGRATLEPPVPGLTERMARRYLGFAGAIGYLRAAREAIEQSEEVTIALVPDRPLTQDFSPETPLVGRLWLRAKRVLPPWL